MAEPYGKAVQKRIVHGIKDLFFGNLFHVNSNAPNRPCNAQTFRQFNCFMNSLPDKLLTCA